MSKNHHGLGQELDVQRNSNEEHFNINELKSHFFKRMSNTESWPVSILEKFIKHHNFNIDTIKKLIRVCSKFFILLFSCNINNIHDINYEILKESLSKSRDREIYIWSYRIMLWLVVEKNIEIDFVLHFYLEKNKNDFYIKIAKVTSPILVAKDLLDKELIEYNALTIPNWAIIPLKKFLKLNKNIDFIYGYIVIFIRWLCRHFDINSYFDIKPIYLSQFRNSMYSECNNIFWVKNIVKFIKFLSNYGCVPRFLYYAFYETFYKKIDVSCKNIKKDNTICDSLMLYNSIVDVLNKMESFGYSKTVLNVARNTIIGYSLYMYDKNIRFSIYNAKQWCRKLEESTIKRSCSQETALYFAYKIITKSEISLENLINERYLPNRIFVRNYPQWSVEQVSKFLKSEKYKGFAKTTIDHKETVLLKFLNYLNNNNIKDFSDITIESINNFVEFDIHKSTGGKSKYNIIVRQFLFYLAENGKIKYNIALSMLGCCGVTVNPIKILSEKQKEKLFNFCDNAESEIDKRSKLIFLFAIRLGLRGTDITNLTLNNINIDTKEIIFIQKKTKKEIKLPIQEELFKAICDYLLRTERKNIDNKNIFTTTKAPYKELVSPSVRQIILKFDCEKFTLHDMRRTLASELLKSNIDVWKIAEILGHSNLETIHKYLSSEIDILRECCLDNSELDMPDEVWV